MYGIITKQCFEGILSEITKDKKNKIPTEKLREQVAIELGFNEEEMKVNLLPKALEKAMFNIGWVYDPVDDKYELKHRKV